MSDLKTLFNPKSIAIIGASANKEKVGYFVLRNIIEGGYKGRIYPVNHKTKEILGTKVYKDIFSIPESPEVAVIIIPRDSVLDSIKELGKKGTKYIIVITSGFKESDEHGMLLEKELYDTCQQYDIRMIGPNCLGVISPILDFNASFVYEMPLKGTAAVISQSGAVGTAVLDIFKDIGVGFSYFVSVGNQADIDEAELLEYFAEDENTKVVCMYLEGVKDGKRFLEAAKNVTRKKPLIILKAGISSKGAEATTSHTGSLAGSNVAYKAAFREVNAIQVLTLEDFSQLTALFSSELPPSEDGVAILTNAGGPGILATDAAERWNVGLANLDENTKRELRDNLPVGTNVNNPIDILGDAMPERYRIAAEILSKDKNVKTVLLLLTVQAQTEPVETAIIAKEVFIKKGIPVVATFIGGSHVKDGRKKLRVLGVPNVNFAEKAMKLLGYIRQQHVYTDDEFQKPNGIDLIGIKNMIHKCNNECREWMLGQEALEVIGKIGIQIPVGIMTNTPQEAISFAENNGYPIALKVVSDDIVHKSDFGGVALKLQNPQDITNAYKTILNRIKEKAPHAKIDGILAHEHVRGGRELIIGAKRDTQFGAMVMFGVGGVWVEANPDVTFRLAPINAKEAFEMIREIKAARVLGTFRGKPPADINALVDSLVRLSYVVHMIEDIEEIEINPILTMLEGEGSIAVDGRIKIKIDKS